MLFSESYDDEELFELEDDDNKEYGHKYKVANSWVYEALGAPTLLYRNTGGTRSDGTMLDSLGIDAFRKDDGRKSTVEADLQNAARHGGFVSSDSVPVPKPLPTRNLKKSQKDFDDKLFVKAWHRSNKRRIRTTSRAFDREDDCLRLKKLYRINNIPVDYVYHESHRYHFQDLNYISNSAKAGKNIRNQLESALYYHRECLHASTREGYAAPFSSSCIDYAYRANYETSPKDSLPTSDNVDNTHRALHDNHVQHPLDYGNCLLILPCRCRICHLGCANKGHIIEKEGIVDANIVKNLLSPNSSDSTDHDSKNSINRSMDDHHKSEILKESNSFTPSQSESDNDSSNNSLSTNSQTSVNSSTSESTKSSQNDNVKMEVNDDKHHPTYTQTESESSDRYDHDNRWLVIHPIGDCLSISKIKLPNENRYKPNCNVDDKNNNNDLSTIKKQIDIGGSILQVCGCFDVDEMLETNSKEKKKQSTNSKDFFNNQPLFVMTRTQNFCKILICSMVGDVTDNSQVIQARNVQGTNDCMNDFDLREVERVDLSYGKRGVSYIPTFIAANPVTPHPYLSDPSFAILSRSASSRPIWMGFTSKGIGSKRGEEYNVIHHVLSRETGSRVKKHSIENLELISQIEFSRMNPMVLWSSARSTVPPPMLVTHDNIVERRPITGYGQSLYSIDLRSNKGSLMWSPSHAQKLPERIHSVSGILPDREREHVVTVSSLSAEGKVWQIDVRMPLRPICSWQLPGYCDSWKSKNNFGGIYGSGAILTSPVAVSFGGRERFPCNEYYGSLSGILKPWYPPILTISKSCSYGLSLNQEPLSFPRFHTNSLECVASSHMDTIDNHGVHTSCFSKSSVFKHPDTSAGDFIIGLKAFYTATSKILKKPSNLGYKTYPSRSMCILSCTNKGDLYAHTLLECDANEDTKGKAFEGLPVGSIAVAIPPEECKSNLYTTNGLGDLELNWNLSNEFPIPSQSLLPHHVSTKAQCRPFISVKLKDIPKFSDEHDFENQSEEEINDKTSFGIYYGKQHDKSSNKDNYNHSIRVPSIAASQMMENSDNIFLSTTHKKIEYSDNEYSSVHVSDAENTNLSAVNSAEQHTDLSSSLIEELKSK